MKSVAFVKYLLYLHYRKIYSKGSIAGYCLRSGGNQVWVLGFCSATLRWMMFRAYWPYIYCYFRQITRNANKRLFPLAGKSSPEWSAGWLV